MADHVDQVYDSRAGLPAAIGVSLAAFLLFGLMWTCLLYTSDAADE